jgi:hypothetical protein
MKTCTCCLLFLLLGLTSCKKNGESPYIEYKDITQNSLQERLLTVALGDTVAFLVDNGYDRPEPTYLMKLNDENDSVVEPSIVQIKSHGWNGQKELNTELVEVMLPFDSAKYSIGDQLEFLTRHSGIEASIMFEIE